MQRKGWIAGGLALAIALGVLALMWGGDEVDPADEMARIGAADAPSGGALGSGGADPGASPGANPVRGRQVRAGGDAGVGAAAAPPSRGSRPAPPNARGELQRGAEGDSRSAGWRLGRTRARIELIQPRIERMQERAAELAGRGEHEAAERQQGVLARFERRLEELRAEETALSAEAERDGTLDEVELGMEESAALSQTDRPPVPAQRDEQPQSP